MREAPCDERHVARRGRDGPRPFPALPPRPPRVPGRRGRAQRAAGRWGSRTPTGFPSRPEPDDPARHLPESNPFTYAERRLMVEAAAGEAGVGPVEVIPFPITEPDLWDGLVPAGAVQFVRVLSPWGSSKLARLRERGYATVVLDAPGGKTVSGEQVRARHPRGRRLARAGAGGRRRRPRHPPRRPCARSSSCCLTAWATGRRRPTAAAPPTRPPDTPNLDALAAAGSCGLLWPLGPGRAPSSEVAHWAMLGYRAGGDARPRGDGGARPRAGGGRRRGAGLRRAALRRAARRRALGHRPPRRRRPGGGAGPGRERPARAPRGPAPPGGAARPAGAAGRGDPARERRCARRRDRLGPLLPRPPARDAPRPARARGRGDRPGGRGVDPGHRPPRRRRHARHRSSP